MIAKTTRIVGLRRSLANTFKTKNMVELLISKGADVNAKDKDGKTPLQITNNEKVKELLRKHGGHE